MPRFRAETLQRLAEELLTAGGVPRQNAQRVAASLVRANLCGYESHGVMRIPYYVEAIEAGRINPAARLEVVRETEAVLVADGGWGLGQVLCHELADRLAEKAKRVGVACGTLRRCGHIGRLGEYAEVQAERRLACILCVNNHGAAQRVAPVGGKRPRLGTNPLCIGVPGGREGPFILDFSTSVTAEGKVRVKRIAGESVPPGWLLDSEGRPTTDPNQLYADPPGSILPMGGAQAYKGFGLALMIEMLAGGLSGGRTAHPDPPPPLGNCVFFLVLDPEQFAGFEHLEKEVQQLETYVRTVPRIDGVEEIVLPGDPERRTARQRSQAGIELDEGNWRALVQLAERLGVELPTAEDAAGQTD